ncbi:putative short chain dehydrogenase/oxidoreductase [Tothia fuscella]|uniref:Short chain dehydrogenase/oxidoreductase n=1 Tax=Tothia fuscella TaxID=1048955 RepID=A0A9P4NUC5_9PEZI|nr:putative short chain dehydrogenase/oxidoreductase [Tothia fuscella]
MSSTTSAHRTCIVTGGADDCAKSLLEEDRARLVTLKADVTSASDMEGVFATVIEKFGQINVVVNNAGIADHFAPIGDVEKEYLERVLAVNTVAPAMISEMAVRHMLKQDPSGGTILNVASASGAHGFRAGVAYAMSKHVVIGLTKNIAAFYGPKGIRYVAIMPGGMATNIVSPEMMENSHQEGLQLAMKMRGAGGSMCPFPEVAKVVLSLCSDGMQSVNGACVSVDNGWTSF